MTSVTDTVIPPPSSVFDIPLREISEILDATIFSGSESDPKDLSIDSPLFVVNFKETQGVISDIVVTSKNPEQQVLLTVVSTNNFLLQFIPDINGYNHFSVALQGDEYIFVLSNNVNLLPSICGPVIRVYDLGNNNLLIHVTDNGYRYILKGDRVEIVREVTCNLVTSSFTIIIPFGVESERELIRYILSGFVYDKFRIIEDVCEFKKRLSLTPFRNFVSIIQ